MRYPILSGTLAITINGGGAGGIGKTGSAGDGATGSTA